VCGGSSNSYLSSTKKTGINNLASNSSSSDRTDGVSYNRVLGLHMYLSFSAGLAHNILALLLQLSLNNSLGLGGALLLSGALLFVNSDALLFGNVPDSGTAFRNGPGGTDLLGNVLCEGRTFGNSPCGTLLLGNGLCESGALGNSPGAALLLGNILHDSSTLRNSPSGTSLLVLGHIACGGLCLANSLVGGGAGLPCDGIVDGVALRRMMTNSLVAVAVSSVAATVPVAGLRRR